MDTDLENGQSKAAAAGAAPVATFTCKGRHALVNTYRSHPNDDDLLAAFLFGMRLVKRFGDSNR